MLMTTRESLDRTVKRISQDNPAEAARVISLWLEENDLLQAPLTAEEIDSLPVKSQLKIGEETWTKIPYAALRTDTWISSSGKSYVSVHALMVTAEGNPIELVRFGSIYQRSEV